MVAEEGSPFRLSDAAVIREMTGAVAIFGGAAAIPRGGPVGFSGVPNRKSRGQTALTPALGEVRESSCFGSSRPAPAPPPRQ